MVKWIKIRTNHCTAHTSEHFSLVFLTLFEDEWNAQQFFRLRPAALWEMQVEILQVVVRTHGSMSSNMEDVKSKHWLPHMVKYTVCRLACELRQTHKYVVEKGKCWGVEPLDKCKVTIATSAFRCRLLWQQFFVSKTTLSHVCITEEVELHLLFMTNYLPS